MLLFLFMLLPLSLIMFLFTFRDKRNRPVVFIGLLAGILICIIKAIFVFAHRIVPNSMLENYFFFFFNQSILPQVILYGLVLLIAKDDMNFKLQAYFPLLCTFYALYLPYCVISANESEVYSGFAIFIKPLIYLAMLVLCQMAIQAFAPERNKKTFVKVIAAFIMTIYLLLPAFLETLYVLNAIPVLFIILTAAYIILPCLMVVIYIFKNCKSKEVVD